MARRRRLILIGFIGSVALAALAVACSAADDFGSADSSERAQPEGPDAGDAFSLVEGGELGDGASNNAEAPSGAPPADSSADLQGLLDRKIILSTSIDVDVEDVARDFQEVIRLAETSGGFVSSSSFTSLDDSPAGDVTIRVPSDQYQSVLQQVRGMGEVSQESSDANDATEEYTDLQARLRTLEATESRYLELLNQAENINDILTVQDRLDVIRGQIEQVQGRINLLDELTDLATITVHLRPIAAVAAPSGGGLSPVDAAQGAWEASLTALRAVAAVGVAVLVFSWWLIPLVVVFAAAARWLGSRRPSATGPAA